MRSLTALFGLVILAACASPTTTTNPPPPPQPPSNTPRTLFDAQNIATGGGTLTYTKAGDPLNGLAITIPAGAYSTASTWTVTADSTVTVSLPQDFAQVGPVLVVNNNQGYSNGVMTLTMPMSIPADNTVVPFFFDPTTSKLEAIPLIDRTATSATLGTRHFTLDLTATRGPTQTLLRAAGSAFGAVYITWVRAADTTLKGTFTTGFRPGRDDWEFSNYGDYVSPGGDCEGMSVTALYYQYFVKSPGSSFGLYHQYDSNLLNQWDNVQGIRFVGSVQGDYDDLFASGVDQIATLTKSATYYRSNLKTLTATWLMLTLKLTGNPVLMALRGTVGGHAVVAYAGASSGGTNVDISFADPNYPGTVRTMTFVSGVLTPVSLQLNKTAAGSNFTDAYALGVTADVPLKNIDSRYAEFKVHRAGADRFPSGYTWSYKEGTTVRPLDNTVIHTGVALFTPQVDCPACQYHTTGTTDLIPVTIWDANGQNELPTQDGPTSLVRGDNNFVLVVFGFSPFDPAKAIGFVDSKSVDVIYTPPVGFVSLSVAITGGTRPVSQTAEIVPTGGTLPLIATVRATDSVVVVEPVTWTTSNPAIATVNTTTGVVTGLAGGTAVITARSTSNTAISASVTVVVSAPNTNPIASMVILPKPWTMPKGTSKQFTVTLRDAQGNITTPANGISVAWAVDDSNLGSIDPATGLFQASSINTGTTTIRVFLIGQGAPQNVFDSASVTVTN